MDKILSLSMLLAMAIFSIATCAEGDIYRYVNNEGVTCFTDVPTTSEAVVIMKDPDRLQRVSNKKIPWYKSPTGSRKDVSKIDGFQNNGRNEKSLPVIGRITSVTGLRHDPIDGNPRFHNGIDIAVPSGTPIKPVAPGRVTFSGTRPGYGNMVVLEHQDGSVTLYAHNSVNLVTEGVITEANEIIALSGSTGRSTGPHLHFEAWKDGINTTSDYMAAGNNTSIRNNDDITRLVSADGSLIFTNMR